MLETLAIRSSTRRAMAIFAFEFEIIDDELEAHVHIEGGTVDGVDGVDGEFPVELLHIVTDANFTPPRSGWWSLRSPVRRSRR